MGKGKKVIKEHWHVDYNYSQLGLSPAGNSLMDYLERISWFSHLRQGSCCSLGAKGCSWGSHFLAHMACPSSSMPPQPHKAPRQRDTASKCTEIDLAKFQGTFKMSQYLQWEQSSQEVLQHCGHNFPVIPAFFDFPNTRNPFFWSSPS